MIVRSLKLTDADCFHSNRLFGFRQRLQVLLCLLFTAIAASGCTPSKKPASNAEVAASDDKLKVVVTTSMVGDLVRQVAGDHVNVTGLMGEGVDPHLYRPTSRDLGLMMQSDLIFYSGLGLEGAMQTAFEKVAKNGKVIAAVTNGIPRDTLIFSERFSGHPDPHVWHDAALWAGCLDEVVAVLTRADPKHAETFKANAEAYRSELHRLDLYAKDSLASIPEAARFLVTAHDAFAYFSRTYHLQEKSVQGITTESEPGVQDINQLVDFLVKQKVPSLFVEATVNAANLKAVIEGAQRQGWTVQEGGTLFSDSTGAPGTYEGTYSGMFDHNVTTITRALGGQAPERGLNGKLAALRTE